jgi:hypothetical protein
LFTNKYTYRKWDTTVFLSSQTITPRDYVFSIFYKASAESNDLDASRTASHKRSKIEIAVGKSWALVRFKKGLSGLECFFRSGFGREQAEIALVWRF